MQAKRDGLQITRELVNKSLDAADQADVKRQALMTLNEKSVNYLAFPSLRGQVHTVGSALIPACLMAITKGDDDAVPVARLSLGSLDGTKRPMIMVPPM